jgi:electron transfer flavoprotein beta subunit
MGADSLVLLQDDAFANTVDSFAVARILTAAINKLGPFDLIIAGRQASDWDNAQVPLAVAELLDLPSITIGKKVEVGEGRVTVERQMPEGTEIVEAPMPALVTVSNELGQPRYPTLRGIMAATRKRPTIWSAGDLELDSGQMEARVTLHELFIPQRTQACEFIEGDDEVEAARNLALRLREAKLI